MGVVGIVDRPFPHSVLNLEEVSEGVEAVVETVDRLVELLL